jgi:hypothetical protein
VPCRQLAFFDWPDSDMAMATACFRLRTFFPEPLFSVPFLCSCITLWTFFLCVAVAMNLSPKNYLTRKRMRGQSGSGAERGCRAAVQ